MVALDRAAVTVVLADGAAVQVREAQPGDDESLRRMYLGLTDRTRYLYFCAGVPSNDDWAQRFAALGRADGRILRWLRQWKAPSLAWRALIAARRESAEIGLLLADAWQSRGLGRAVLTRLTLEARRRAVTRFTVHTLWENRRMLRLARSAFPHLDIDCSQGACELMLYFE